MLLHFLAQGFMSGFSMASAGFTSTTGFSKRRRLSRGLLVRIVLLAVGVVVSSLTLRTPARP